MQFCISDNLFRPCRLYITGLPIRLPIRTGSSRIIINILLIVEKIK